MRLRALLLGLVPIVGLAELALQQYSAHAAPGFEAYAGLAPELMKAKLPGMPVVVSPRWAEPLVRQAAPAAFPLAELTRADDGAFRSFLEVSLRGEHAPELTGFAQRESRRFGPFTLTVRDSPKPEPARFDFVTAVGTAEVEVWNDVAGERTPCRFVDRGRSRTGGLHGPAARPGRRHECPDGAVVAVTLIEDQSYRPRRCILVDPVAHGHVVLRFNTVPVSARLVGFTGFSYFLHRDVQGKQVSLRVREGARELGTHHAEPSAGWSRFELERGEPFGAAVEVQVERLSSEPGDFCFALEAR